MTLFRSGNSYSTSFLEHKEHPFDRLRMIHEGHDVDFVGASVFASETSATLRTCVFFAVPNLFVAYGVAASIGYVSNVKR